MHSTTTRQANPETALSNATEDLQRRILIFAPTLNDGSLTAGFLEGNGVPAQVCSDMEEVSRRIEEGCGAIFLAEEALNARSIRILSEPLAQQPSWSDIPIAVITGNGKDPSHARFQQLAALEPGGNVTIIERPFRPDTLVKNAEVALRSRERQYQVRDLLEESRKREEELRASEERFRRMSDSAPVMIWMAGLDQEFVWLNKAWCDFTGRPMDEGLGDGWTEQIHPDDRFRCLRLYSTHFKANREFRVEFRMRRHDGNWRWLLNHGAPLYGAASKLMGFIGSCVDITERKETLAELEKLVSERTATLRKTIGDLEAFSYTVSHDLRAPLRAIQSYAQILGSDYRDEVLDTQGLEYLERIIKAGSRLDGLIQDVLTYSKVARRDYHLHPVDLSTLVADILRQYPDLRGPGVKVRVDDSLPEVYGSEALLTQCLSNLLMNAVKFVSPGQDARIRIRAEKNGTSARLWVEDNGIGIPPESQTKIFGMFERLDQKNYEGTGVGLAIVRKAVEQMGGKIGVVSQPGKGSRFWIQLERVHP